jgi:hypothetical protein
MGVQRGRRGAIRRVLGVCWVLGSMSQQRMLSSPRAGPKRCRNFSCRESEGVPRSHICSPPKTGGQGVEGDSPSTLDRDG